jgi:hypothetical protein
MKKRLRGEAHASLAQAEHIDDKKKIVDLSIRRS